MCLGPRIGFQQRRHTCYYNRPSYRYDISPFFSPFSLPSCFFALSHCYCTAAVVSFPLPAVLMPASSSPSCCFVRTAIRPSTDRVTYAYLLLILIPGININSSFPDLFESFAYYCFIPIFCYFLFLFSCLVLLCTRTSYTVRWYFTSFTYVWIRDCFLLSLTAVITGI